MSTDRTIALWSSSDLPGLGDQLLPRITQHELNKRLPGWPISWYAPQGWTKPAVTDGGFIAEPLGAYRPSRIKELSDTTYQTIVCPSFALGADLRAEYKQSLSSADFFTYFLGNQSVLFNAVRITAEAQELVAAVSASEYIAVRDQHSRDVLVSLGISQEILVIPHPGLLAAELIEQNTLITRRGHLRQLRSLPEESYLVAQVNDPDKELPLLREILDALQCSLNIKHIVLLQTAPTVEWSDYQLPAAAVLEDRLAVISGAKLVLATDEHTAAAATSFKRPWILFDPQGKHASPVVEFGYQEQIVNQSELLPTALTVAMAANKDVLPRLVEHFDRLADIIRQSSPNTAARRELLIENHALRKANATLRNRLFLERQQLIERLMDSLQCSSATSEPSQLAAELAQEKQLHAELAERYQALLVENARLQHDSTELHALRRTKLFRWAEPVRRAYGRLRRR